GSNRIHTANHHLWAEPLDEAISKVLVRDIAELTMNVAVERDAGRWSRSADCRLRVEFDKFHATDRSTVVSSGRYWLLVGDRETRLGFDISERLTADGHANAVSALRQSLKTIATQMGETIRNECRPAKSADGESTVAVTG
ncbi:MAG: ABC-type transport auxiliary lipoprotein family protein, partial [Woeseiaceae bacterium]|nr:ABC-type transport auxiliary lipoprotein family protein [Woeseiaceae bacterium]